MSGRLSLSSLRSPPENNFAKLIGKAIDNQENPIKEKHIKKIIALTFQGTGTFNAYDFWSAILKLPVKDNKIVAWKCCHVLYRILREGHPAVVAKCQWNRKEIEDLGKSWDRHAKLIQHYTRLLITKWDFHRRNPLFPGNLDVTEEELGSVGDSDPNKYFQLSIEMFDYLGDMLTFQAAVFGSLDLSRCSPTMPSGHCRLAPLIPCIQDSSRLYDHCVKILFWLHSRLSSDTLIGHRERFLKQFRILREFYINADNVQYLKNLIQIPLLPDNPPNFLFKFELSSYVTQPSAPFLEDEEESDIIDDFSSSESDSANDSLYDLDIQHDSLPPEQIVERDHLILQLRNEIVSLKENIKYLNIDSQNREINLSRKIEEMKKHLDAQNSILLQERQLKENLKAKIDKLEMDLTREKHLKECLLNQMEEQSKGQLRTEFQIRREEVNRKIDNLEISLATKEKELLQERTSKDGLKAKIAKLEMDLVARLSFKEREGVLKNNEWERRSKEQPTMEFQNLEEELRRKVGELKMQLDIQTSSLLQERQTKEELKVKVAKMEMELATKNDQLPSKQAECHDWESKIAKLETDLATKNSQLLQERQQKENLLRHTEETSKYHEYEKRAKTMEDKFQRLKDVYTKLREEPDQMDGFLVDTSDTTSTSNEFFDSGHRNGSISPEQIAERDHIIHQIQNEITRLREKIQHLRMEFQKQTEELSDKIAELETDLATKDSELLQERQLKEDLLRHMEEASKYHEYEKRAKTMEYKFQRLKDVYTKLREEHIQLIRAKAEIEKQSVTAKQSYENAMRVNEELSTQLNQLLYEKTKTEENLEQIKEIAAKLTFPKEQKNDKAN